ncbi:response regulator [Lutibacter sp. TH_r2]|uniref:response regulator n=1 Tax=Lutibacter sp. TH_r2 TaxID=3082083 RepID=UPI0029530676|nr:transporter substrate-binding domain-containing protein [Lutibacter sp. TH_r2]MDV7187907.1 response regulator [Lutibacter sp. TH_r2]
MRHYFLIITIILVLISSKVNAQYKVLFSNNYPPYNYINENNELVGFNIDILNAIKDLYGSDISIDSGDWVTINNFLNNNEVDAIGGAHYPGGFENDFIYSRSSINTSHCFFYNKNHIKRFSLEYLRTSKEPLIAMWKNDVLEYYILSINPSAKFLYIKNYESLINAVDKKEVTCAFGQRVGGMFYAKKLHKDYIEALNHRILERSMGFKISKQSSEFAEILNNGLEVILANGEYQKIYDKWIAEYDESKTNWDQYLKYILFSGIIILAIIILLISINRILRSRVRDKTKDLRSQLQLNSEMMKELKKQKNKAEESDKMKSAFLANMSHEIRTPMNGILGFADLLKNAEYSSEKRSQFIEIIEKSGHRMLQTINNIIDISKLQSGLEEVQLKKVNILNIIEELQHFFEPEATTKGLTLFFKNKNSTITKPFYSDEQKLNSILTNLIKNALKFTPKGSIEVEYTLQNDVAEFWVKDAGIGIPYKKQTTIFNEFVQADFSHSSGFEGSGLGLSISKGYVDLLNGDIQLKSKPNVGSTFYVRIPNSITTIPETNTSLENTISNNSILPKFKILIAEDDETSFEYLKTVLEDITEKILHAKNGIEAIELAKQNADIDVILMDIKMPKLNGLEASKEIRKFNKNIFIIAQSAYTQKSYKNEAEKVGCNTFISKPINKQKLLAIFSNIKN